MVAARRIPQAPATSGALVEALADMLANAATYAGSAGQFYALDDTKGGDFALRKAAAFMQIAAEIRAEIAGVSLTKRAHA